jgi:hypothetical protein
MISNNKTKFQTSIDPFLGIDVSNANTVIFKPDHPFSRICVNRLNKAMSRVNEIEAGFLESVVQRFIEYKSVLFEFAEMADTRATVDERLNDFFATFGVLVLDDSRQSFLQKLIGMDSEDEISYSQDAVDGLRAISDLADLLFLEILMLGNSLICDFAGLSESDRLLRGYNLSTFVTDRSQLASGISVISQTLYELMETLPKEQVLDSILFQAESTNVATIH